MELKEVKKNKEADGYGKDKKHEVEKLKKKEITVLYKWIKTCTTTTHLINCCWPADLPMLHLVLLHELSSHLAFDFKPSKHNNSVYFFIVNT